MLTLQRFDTKCICCKSQPADVDLDDERKKSPLKKAGCQNVRKCGCQNSWRKLGVSILKSKAIDLDAVPYLCKWISLFHFVNVIQFNFIQFIYLKLCERFWFWKQHKLCVHLHTLFVIIFGGKLQLQQLKNHTILFKIIIVFQSDDHKNLYKFQIVFRLCYESIMFSRQHYYSVITKCLRCDFPFPWCVGTITAGAASILCFAADLADLADATCLAGRNVFESIDLLWERKENNGESAKWIEGIHIGMNVNDNLTFFRSLRCLYMRLSLF